MLFNFYQKKNLAFINIIGIYRKYQQYPLTLIDFLGGSDEGRHHAFTAPLAISSTRCIWIFNRLIDFSLITEKWQNLRKEFKYLLGQVQNLPA